MLGYHFCIRNHCTPILSRHKSYKFKRMSDTLNRYKAYFNYQHIAHKYCILASHFSQASYKLTNIYNIDIIIISHAITYWIQYTSILYIMLGSICVMHSQFSSYKLSIYLFIIHIIYCAHIIFASIIFRI